MISILTPYLFVVALMLSDVFNTLPAYMQVVYLGQIHLWKFFMVDHCEIRNGTMPLLVQRLL